MAYCTHSNISNNLSSSILSRYRYEFQQLTIQFAQGKKQPRTNIPTRGAPAAPLKARDICKKTSLFSVFNLLGYVFCEKRLELDVLPPVLHGDYNSRCCIKLHVQ